MECRMIPTVKMKVPVLTVQEYAASPVATSPSRRHWFDEKETDVDVDFAAFLIDEGELDIDEYIDVLMMEFEEHLHPDDDEGFEALREGLEEYIQQRADSNRRTWADYE